MLFRLGLLLVFPEQSMKGQLRETVLITLLMRQGSDLATYHCPISRVESLVLML